MHENEKALWGRWMFGVDGGGGYLGLFFVLLSDLIILYMRFLCGGGD